MSTKNVTNIKLYIAIYISIYGNQRKKRVKILLKTGDNSRFFVIIITLVKQDGKLKTQN